MKKSKTIYFLGAGFSKDAGGQVQTDISKTLMCDAFKEYVESKRPGYGKFVDELHAFLFEELCVSTESFDNLALEDIFTPIDRCISNGLSFGRYSLMRLVRFRERLHNLLSYAIQYGIDCFEKVDNAYIPLFAKYIDQLAQRRVADVSDDRVAVITTNWDVQLDNALNKVMHNSVRNEEDALRNKMEGVVDYCCFMNSLGQPHYATPGLLALGQGGYTVKLLKLHGSLNWLHCPMCNRLYVMDESMTLFGRHYCRHCAENYSLKKENASIRLQHNLLLPTFLKNLNNIQIQLVWQNAGIELSEATKIVFMGYSLPAADFEIRQLLSRYLRKDVEVEVVLFPDSGSLHEQEARYRGFFGKRISQVIVDTVPNYIHSVMSRFC
jgi:NAD-dependent SIR2 family protein deacetylase